MATPAVSDKSEWIIINGKPVQISQPVAVSQPVQSAGATSGDSKDVKSADQKAVVAVPRLLQGRSAGAKFAAPVKVKLVGRYTLTSSAATPLSTVQALSPLAVSDFSSFAAVYDLVRTLSIRVHFCCLSSAVVAGFSQYAIAWDPSNIGAYSSISDVLTAQVHQGPFLIGGGTSTREPSLSSTPTGFHSMSAKLPVNKITNDSTAANIIGGAWMGTSNTTGVIGWIKPYVDSFGVGVSSTIDMYVTYYVEFKSRT